MPTYPYYLFFNFTKKDKIDRHKIKSIKYQDKKTRQKTRRKTSIKTKKMNHLRHKRTQKVFNRKGAKPQSYTLPHFQIIKSPNHQIIK